MQKCYYRSENDYFQVEQFTSRSFKVRSIFHTSSWTQHNNVPVSKSMETVQENRSSQSTTCTLFSIRLDIFIEGHFHISLQLVLFLSDLRALNFLAFRNKQTFQNQKNQLAT